MNTVKKSTVIKIAPKRIGATAALANFKSSQFSAKPFISNSIHTKPKVMSHKPAPKVTAIKKVPTQHPSSKIAFTVAPKVLMKSTSGNLNATAQAKSAIKKRVLSRFKHVQKFTRGMHVLVVGDGNLTFSKTVAQVMKDEGMFEEKDEDEAAKFYATTFHTYEDLKELYPDTIDSTISTIEKSGATVMHGIDATDMGTHFFEKFDLIIWNFPHAGCVKGFRDGHPMVSWRHVNLMRKFFRSSREVCRDEGMIVVTTNEKAHGVNAPDMVKFAEVNEFKNVEKFSFTDWNLSAYERAFGDYRDCSAAKRARTSEGGVKSDKYGQQKSADFVYSFSAKFDETYHLPSLELLPAPKPSDLVAGTEACACGLICPTDQVSYFAPSHFNGGAHAKLTGTQKLEAAEELLMSFHCFTY